MVGMSQETSATQNVTQTPAQALLAGALNPPTSTEGPTIALNPAMRLAIA